VDFVKEANVQILLPDDDKNQQGMSLYHSVRVFGAP
jgi:hypothetical protein